MSHARGPAGSLAQGATCVAAPPGTSQAAVRDAAFPFARRAPCEGGPATLAPVVFVVHDDTETCDHIRALAEAAGLKVRTYADAAAFLAELSLDSPGCLVIGAQTRSMSASELQGELAARGAHIPVILAAAHADVSTAVTALKAGALDVIEAPFLNQHMVPAILRAIAADLGQRWRHLQRADVQLRYAQLTPREREVLLLVIEGATSSGIARQLGIREKTVEIYRSQINRKMRVRNAVELARVMQSIQ